MSTLRERNDALEQQLNDLHAKLDTANVQIADLEQRNIALVKERDDARAAEATARNLVAGYQQQVEAEPVVEQRGPNDAYWLHAWDGRNVESRVVANEAEGKRLQEAYPDTYFENLSDAHAGFIRRTEKE